MAYLDLNLHQDAAYATPTAAVLPTTVPAADTGFSPLEWSVIALARRDKIASLREPGRLSRALGGVFGRGTQSRLADPRLEAVRRLAVQAWHHGYTLPVSEIGRFLASGFSREQVETLLASIARARAGVRRSLGR